MYLRVYKTYTGIDGMVIIPDHCTILSVMWNQLEGNWEVVYYVVTSNRPVGTVTV